MVKLHSHPEGCILDSIYNCDKVHIWSINQFSFIMFTNLSIIIQYNNVLSIYLSVCGYVCMSASLSPSRTFRLVGWCSSCSWAIVFLFCHWMVTSCWICLVFLRSIYLSGFWDFRLHGQDKWPVCLPSHGIYTTAAILGLIRNIATLLQTNEFVVVISIEFPKPLTLSTSHRLLWSLQSSKLRTKSTTG